MAMSIWQVARSQWVMNLRVAQLGTSAVVLSEACPWDACGGH